MMTENLDKNIGLFIVAVLLFGFRPIDERIESIKEKNADPLHIDVSDTWFGNNSKKREKVKALREWARAEYEANMEAFQSRTSRESTPFSAPEFAEDSAYYVRLFVNLRLMKASESASAYRRLKTHALERLERVREAVQARAEKARSDVDGSASPFIRELRYRAALDQAWRAADGGDLASVRGEAKAPHERRFFQWLLLLETAQEDLANSRWLKAELADHGWPAPEKHGEQAHKDAWTIVQHAAHDLKLQKKALARLRKLHDAGEGSGKFVALLHDRVAMFSGEKQLYGTQFECRDGTYQPYPVKNRDSLSARRASMGLDPIEENSFYGQAC